MFFSFGQQSEMQKKFTDWFLGDGKFLLLILPLGLFAVYHSVFFYAMKWDMVDAFLPMRLFISDCFHNHLFPSWNPYINFGFPVAADLQSGLFYAPLWFFAYVFGYSAYTIQFEYFFHVYVACAGMFFLLKNFSANRWLLTAGAMAYACCGVMTGNAQHLSWIIAAAWLPWYFYFFNKQLQAATYKNSLMLSVVLYLFTTGAYPAFLIVAFYISVLFLLIRWANSIRKKDFVWMKLQLKTGMVFSSVFLLLTAAYFYSWYQSIPFVPRSHGIGIETALFGSFTYQSFISFIWPASLATVKDFGTDISMANAYFSWFFLAGALIFIFRKQIPYHRFIFLLGIVFLVTSLGHEFPMRKWLYEYFPLMDRFRFPSLFRLFSIISFIICGLIAMEQIVVAFHLQKFQWLLLAFVFAEILFNTNQTIPVTVISDVPLSSFNEKIKSLPHAFPIPTKLFSETNESGDGSVAPAYRNCSVLMQQPAANGYYPFYLNSFDSIDESPYRYRFLQNHYCYLSNRIFSDTDYEYLPTENFGLQDVFVNKNSINDLKSFNNLKEAGDTATILSFKPNEIKVLTNSRASHLLVLMQLNYPGWNVSVDGKPYDIVRVNKGFNAAKIPAGKHEVIWKMETPVIEMLYYFTIVIFCLLITLLLFIKAKSMYH